MTKGNELTILRWPVKSGKILKRTHELKCAIFNSALKLLRLLLRQRRQIIIIMMIRVIPQTWFPFCCICCILWESNPCIPKVQHKKKHIKVQMFLYTFFFFAQVNQFLYEWYPEMKIHYLKKTAPRENTFKFLIK